MKSTMIGRRPFLLASCLSIMGLYNARTAGQALRTVKLLVVRKPGLSPTSECVAPCVRGRIYDISGIETFEASLLPGVLSGEPICAVIERPWRNNKSNVSSIPSGSYSASIREDATKPWMTTLDRRWRLELSDVPHRSNIQFHYGEDVGWSEGCFIVGDLIQELTDVGLTEEYCLLRGGEAAIQRLRTVVTAVGSSQENISVVITDFSGLFSDISSEVECP
jgi:hypothetical protein